MRRLNYYVLFFLFFASACGGNKSANSLLRQADAVMQEYPDSALRLIQKIDKQRITRNSTLARYALLYSQALDKNYIDIKSDSLIRPVVDYYLVHGSVHDKAMAMFYLGRVYSNDANKQKAVQALIRAEVFSREIARSDPYLRGLCCASLALHYWSYGGYQEALRLFESAREGYAAAGKKGNVALCFQNQSMIYYDLGYYVEARDLLLQATALFESDCPRNVNLTALKRWTEVLVIVSDTTQSSSHKKSLLRQRFFNASDYDPVCEKFWLSYYYHAEGNVDSTRYFLMKVLDGKNIEQRRWAYGRLYEIEKSAGNCGRALAAYEKERELDDSIRSPFSSVQFMENRLEAEQMQYEYEQLQTRHTYQTIIAILSFFLSIFLLGMLVWATRQWRQRLAVQHAADERTREEMFERLTTAYNELKIQYDEQLRKETEISSNDNREASFCEALEMRLIGLRQLADNAYLYQAKPAAFFKAFSEVSIVNSSSKKQVWADLQYVVNKKFGGVIDYLSSNYAELTAHDLDLCSLICFGFSPLGICFLYGYADDGSLYNKRSRLRQKLELRDGEKLEKFLIELCRRLIAESADTSSV